MANAKVFNPFTGTFDLVRNDLADLGARSHASLSDLTADDHTQYLMHAGRSTVQTLYGSSGSSGTFNIYANASGLFTTGRIAANTGIRLAVGTLQTTGSVALIDKSGTIEFTSGGGSLNAMDLGPNLTFRSGTTGVPVRVLTFSPSITLEGAKSSAQLFLVQPTISPNLVSATPSFGIRAMIVSPNFATPTGTVTVPVTNVTAVDMALSWNSDADNRYSNASVHSLVRLNGPTGTWSHASKLGGTMVGLYVAGDYTALYDNQYSVWSTVAGAVLSHLGPGVFGSNAAPSNANVALEVQSTTQCIRMPNMTTAQRDAMTPLAGMGIYNTTTNQMEKYEAGAWVVW